MKRCHIKKKVFVLSLSLCIYIYNYIYIYTLYMYYMYVNIYIYVYSYSFRLFRGKPIMFFVRTTYKHMLISPLRLTRLETRHSSHPATQRLPPATRPAASGALALAVIVVIRDVGMVPNRVTIRHLILVGGLNPSEKYESQLG